MESSVYISNNSYKISISLNDVSNDPIIKDFIDYLKVKNILNKTTATDNFINDISEEIKSGWFENNKNRFIK